jgi:hypothetical protein
MLFVPGEITGREHCCDRIEPLVKHPGNPLIVAEHFWEGEGVYWPTFLYSEADRLFKLWYFTTAAGGVGVHAPVRPLIDNAEISGRSFLCYAHSEDGLTWRKPSLGRFTIRGSADNNIVLADSGFFLGCTAIIEDPDDADPARRYKLLMYDNDGAGRDGARTAVSPDGIDWTFIGEFPVLPTQDTPALWHDRRNGQYVAFLKTRIDNRRARMISVSRDFEHWSPPVLHLAPDIADAPTLHFYGQSAFHHCGHDFALLNTYEFATQKLALELIAGNGTDWRRLPTRSEVLSPGDPGAWDGGMVLPGLGELITTGDTCRYYYYGSRNRHDAAGGDGAIGLATFTHGRLVGQQFEHDGWFEGVPFQCPGGELSLDAIAREPITVAVCSASYGGPIGGYTREDCAPVQGDSREHAIRWSKNANLDALKGKFIGLRVYGTNSIVYGATLR